MSNVPPGGKVPNPLAPKGKKGKSSSPNKMTSQAHDALLAILIEATGIVIVVSVAGISDSVANLMLLFAVALWLLYLVMNADTVAKFSQVLTNIESGAKQ